MGKIRSIKPEFFLHDGLFDLEQETGFPIRVAFAGLWTQCDREGRFCWKPRLLKIQILPYDDLDFERVLDALVTRAFLVKYESESQVFGWIPSFTRHQVINNREADSRLPAPPDFDACPTRAPRVGDATGTPLESAQVEGNGKEGNGNGKEGSGRVVVDATPPGKSGKFDPVSAELPAALRTFDFRDKAWPEFCQFRREIGKRLTPTGTANLLRSLEAMGSEKAVVALRTSMTNGWQGVFPPDQRKASNGELTFQGLKDFVAGHPDEQI